MSFLEVIIYIIFGAVSLAIGTIFFYLTVLVFKILKKETNFPFHLPSIITGITVMIVSFLIMYMNFSESGTSEEKDSKEKVEQNMSNTEENTPVDPQSELVSGQESSTTYADCPKCGSIYNPRSWGEMCPKCWENGEALKCPHGNLDSPKFCDLCYPK